MPLGDPMTLEQMQVTQEYIEQYPYSDEAMYLRFCSESENMDRHRKHFIEWFENGKKPPLTMGRYKLNYIVAQLKEMGVHEETFINIKTCVSKATMQKLWLSGSSISHSSSEQIAEDILKIFDMKVIRYEN